MPTHRAVIIGGGAAGFFGAITCAEAAPHLEVILLEASPQVLTKVRISGGGRCNVTHACFEPRALVGRYPRGGRELLGAFHQWQPRDTIAWFAARGVSLKTEADGRMFPVTDDSATIVDCLLTAARQAGVTIRTRSPVARLATTVSSADDNRPEGRFLLTLASGETLTADTVLLATGGPKPSPPPGLAEQVGHGVEPPVPSLFTFNLADPRLQGLAGVSVPVATARVSESSLQESGPLLVTHWGLSGPAILKLSAWGARELHARGYRFSLSLNWLGSLRPDQVRTALQDVRSAQPRRLVANACPFSELPLRLWEKLTAAAAIDAGMTWTATSNEKIDRLVRQLTAGEYSVEGKSTHKDEFVTCGGVRLREVDFKTMQSRLHAGLHFAGEALDIDGITGGFNFQAAWTTGFLAGRAMGVTA